MDERRFDRQDCPVCHGRGTIERVAFEEEAPIVPIITYEMPSFRVETVQCEICEGSGVQWVLKRQYWPAAAPRPTSD